MANFEAVEVSSLKPPDASPAVPNALLVDSVETVTKVALTAVSGAVIEEETSHGSEDVDLSLHPTDEKPVADWGSDEWPFDPTGRPVLARESPSLPTGITENLGLSPSATLKLARSMLPKEYADAQMDKK